VGPWRLGHTGAPSVVIDAVPEQVGARVRAAAASRWSSAIDSTDAASGAAAASRPSRAIDPIDSAMDSGALNAAPSAER